MSNLFIKFAGIDGNVTAQGYKGWSMLYSLHVNINRPISTQPGKTVDRMKGYPVFSGLTVIKPTDESTNRILQAACSGKVIAQVDIHVCASSADLAPYEKFLLENVLVADFDKTVVQESQPAELLKLDFTSIQHTYLPRDASSKQTSPISSGYDLTKAASF